MTGDQRHGEHAVTFEGEALEDLLAPLGPLSSLALLRRDADGTAMYRALYGTTAVNWQIAVDKNHKITFLKYLQCRILSLSGNNLYPCFLLPSNPKCQKM